LGYSVFNYCNKEYKVYLRAKKVIVIERNYLDNLELVSLSSDLEYQGKGKDQ